MTPVDAGGISPREGEVLAGLGDHLTNAEIGQRLHISVRTVESHVSSLMRKLGATDRRELATFVPKLATVGPAARLPVAVLPSTWTTFVGRAAELDELSRALSTERLVTLVGPGGIGKTRLAVLDDLPRHDPFVGGEVADIFHMATESAILVGDLHTALASAVLANEDSTQEGLPHFAAADLVMPLALQGSFDEALRQSIVIREGWERAGRPEAGWMAASFYAAALVHGLRGDADAYQEWWDLASRLSGRGRGKGNIFSIFVAPRVALHRGSIDILRTLDMADDQDIGPFSSYAQAMSAEVAVALGAPDADARVAAAQPLARQNDFAAAQLLRAAGCLHEDRAQLEEAVVLWEAIGARFERAYTLTLLPDRANEGVRELESLACSPPPAVIGLGRVRSPDQGPV